MQFALVVTDRDILADPKDVARQLEAGFVAFVPALVLFVRQGRDARKQSIPLGPFLALGGVVALFWGDAILDWYQDLGRQ